MEKVGKVWEVTAMFMGEYNHSIDPKNRISVPAKFREELGERFCVSIGLGGCLYLSKKEDWDAFVNNLNDLPTTRETRQLQRQFTRNAQECEPDKLGRIIIPQGLVDAAGLKKDVVLLGTGKKIEIWDKDRLDGESTDESMEDIVEKLSTEYGLKF